MVTPEQINLLETKIRRALDFAGKLREENARLKQQNEELRTTLRKLKEDEARLEEGFNSAMGMFDRFDDAIEQPLSGTKPGPVPHQQPSTPPEKSSVMAAVGLLAAAVAAEPSADLASAYTVDEAEEIEEIEAELEEETADLEEDTTEEDTWEKTGDSGEAELDIF